MGGNNFPNNQETIDFMNEAIDILNDEYWAANRPPSDPVEGAAYYDDPGLRVDFSGVTFHTNSAANSLPVGLGSVMLLNELVEPPNEVSDRVLLHLVCPTCHYQINPNWPEVVDDSIEGLAHHTTYFADYTPSVISKGKFNASDTDARTQASHWAHEIGHLLGLNHTYGTGENCNPNHYLHLWDVFGGGPCPHESGYNCDPFSPTNTCTNNIMGSTSVGGYYSPLQIGRIHRNVSNFGMMYWVDGYDPTPYIVEENEEWNFHMKFYQPVIIPNGVTVTVKCMLQMVPQAKLIVQPGGRLIIDGGIITTNKFGSEFWTGIEVWGDNSQNQGGAVVNGVYQDFIHQGYVELRNGGTIEHARCAIAMKNGNVWGTFGGVVRSFGGVFRNNRRAVEFLKYDNTNANGTPINNRSLFRNTLFTVDDDYRGVDDFHVHVSMWEVNGVNFSGCTFENEQTQISESHKLGYGIHTLDAGFQVKASCSSPPPQMNPCPEMYQTPSRFIGLDHGIHALQSSSTRSFHVENSSFSNNVCGVYSEGVVGFTVADNTFEVGGRAVDLTNPLESYWLGSHRAVYSTSGYGFLIEDNSIQRVGAEPSEGIVVGYSGGHNDMVFRNRAQNMDAAFIGEGVCADENARAYIGLHFQCNTNEDNRTNLWSRRVDEDVLSYPEQTIRTNQGQLERAADNTFDRDPLNWDIRNTNSLANAITYWWQTPEVPNQPEYVTNGVIVTDNYNTLPVLRPAGNCATRNVPLVTYPDTDPAPGVSGMQQEGSHYVNSAYLYRQLIDGGSTDAMVEEVMASWPEDVWALRASLLDKSPYLSVKVLKEMVNKPFLPNAIKAEVCIANPDATKSEGFVKWLEYEAAHPLPQNLVDNIVASWDTKTFRTQLEGTLAKHHGAMSQHANLLLRYYQTDSVDHGDSLRWVWQQIRTPAARYAEALTYLQQDRYSEARTVVEELPEEHKLGDKLESERWRMLALIDFAHGIHADGRDLARLNSNEQNALQDIVAGQRDRVATWAQNILCFHYGQCRAPLSGGDGGTPKRRQSEAMSELQAQGSALHVYPNPASHYVVFEVELIAEPTNAAIVVQDITGRILKQLIVTSRSQQLVFDTRELATGTYSIQLVEHGTVTLAKNLTIKQ